MNLATPYFAMIQQQRGLYSFKIVMDETNNTPEVIDRNILKGDIWIQPSRTAEIIIFDFNITNTGASFSE